MILGIILGPFSKIDVFLAWQTGDSALPSPHLYCDTVSMHLLAPIAEISKVVVGEPLICSRYRLSALSDAMPIFPE
jgi:hypothetical protein